MNKIDPDPLAPRRRARLQMAAGKALYRQLRGYASPRECMNAAHFMIPDGSAAKQGDDYSWALRVPGLNHLVPMMIKIEADAIGGWDGAQCRAVVSTLIRADRYGNAAHVRMVWMATHPELCGAPAPRRKPSWGG